MTRVQRKDDFLLHGPQTNNEIRNLRELVNGSKRLNKLTWNPGSLITGSSTTTSVTVEGAVVGDPALAGFSSIVVTGWVITATVIAIDTVEVRITNNTGGTVDLASGTLTVVVVKW